MKVGLKGYTFHRHFFMMLKISSQDDLIRVILVLKNQRRKSFIQEKMARFSSHFANFDEIFGKKLSKFLTIYPENHP